MDCVWRAIVVCLCMALSFNVLIAIYLFEPTSGRMMLLRCAAHCRMNQFATCSWHSHEFVVHERNQAARLDPHFSDVLNSISCASASPHSQCIEVRLCCSLDVCYVSSLLVLWELAPCCSLDVLQFTWVNMQSIYRWLLVISTLCCTHTHARTHTHTQKHKYIHTRTQKQTDTECSSDRPYTRPRCHE